MDIEIIINQLKEKIKNASDSQKISVVEDFFLKILNYDNRLFDGMITEVKIKQPKKTEVFRHIQIGQIFEIYLEDIRKYNYGVVVSGNLLQDKYDYIIIAYLNVFSSTPLEIATIYAYINEHNFLFIANTGYASIRNYDWKLTSQYPNVIFSQNELQQIQYVTFMMGKYYKSIGLSNKSISDCEIIEKEEAENIPNPLGIVGDLEIMEILTDKYKVQKNI